MDDGDAEEQTTTIAVAGSNGEKKETIVHNKDWLVLLLFVRHWSWFLPILVG